MPNQYYVYIMANPRHVLYTGVTNDLERRVWQHKMKRLPGFTSKYDCTSLVYYESTSDVTSAIEREKQINGWIRRRKIALIESINPTWLDLAEVWANVEGNG
jgi:putative endonuclease